MLTAEYFSAQMHKMGPFETRPTLAVAVSGGADSLALAILARDWAQAQGGSIIALTIDHLLRPESSAEAATLQHWLQQMGITHHILRWEETKPAANIQAEAREARYRLLINWCKTHGILHLLLAHHQGDQAETVMLRLERGSGVEGLSAMPLTSSHRGIRLLRPLLDTPKAALQAILTAQNQPWVEDPSNQNPHYARSHIRNFLNNPFEGEFSSATLLSSRLAATASHLGRARASLERSVARAMVETLTLHPEGYCQLQRDRFRQLDEEVGLRLLAAMLTTLGGNRYPPRFEALKRLRTSLHDAAPFSARTLWGCYIIARKGRITFCREPSQVAGSVRLLPGKPVLWDNRFLLSCMAPGIRGEALGKSHLQMLKEQGITISLPEKIIITLPAFKSLESVIAVPHINFYSSAAMDASACFSPVRPLTGQGFHYNDY